MVVRLLQGLLPPALVLPNAPGWVEVSLHHQPGADHRPERKIDHLVAYHPGGLYNPSHTSIKAGRPAVYP